MKPYEYREPGCDVTIRIEPCGDSPGARVRIGKPYIDLEPAEVPAAALALYEASGLPQPVILPWTAHDDGEPLPIGTADRNAYVAGCSLWVERGRVYLVQRNPVSGFDQGHAQLLATAIAMHANAIPELDAAEVDRLADLISAADYDLDYESRHALARTILLGGWKREPAQ
jgi:hypothetical protein